MSRPKSLITVPLVQKLFLAAVVGWLLVVLLAILTGNFEPLMTSELGELGICETNDVLEIVSEIRQARNVLFICGTLVGETKRTIGFDLFFEDRGVYSKSEKLRPGTFWIPIHASVVAHDSRVFPSGQYELRAAYSRDPSIFVHFLIELDP